jgi:ATP-binding cassette subfamily C protein
MSSALPSATHAVRKEPVRDALRRCKPHFVAAAIFSAVGNILLLTPSIYMMQVYDRVVPTGGLVTLAAISVVALFALATLSLLDWLRGRLLIRASAQLDLDLAEPVLRHAVSRPELSQVSRAEAMRDLDTLRQGIASPAAAAVFDVPWTPIYVLAAFLLHWALGLLTLASAGLMLLLAWHNERRIDEPIRVANEAAGSALARQRHISNHAAEVRALGLVTALCRRQLAERSALNRLQWRAAFIGGNHSGLLRFFRLTLQSAALALGALLVVEGSVSGGAVFASSLLLSRALQPIEQMVGAWKTIIQSRLAFDRLGRLFVNQQDRDYTLLPAPLGAIQVERLVVAAPMTDRVALADASFAIAPGEIIGVVGASGAGKSTLLRAIAGATLPARGHIRFDGASSTDWDPERLAVHIGYLPQNFILFPGTVKENIARFRTLLGDDPAAVDAAVIEAAGQIDAHEMILRLPNGYDTLIGTGGIGLSAGQTQRIAIARALYGKPSILILDEPTAHLDGQAQHAFVKLLSGLRKDRTTVLFATHSGDILASADKLLLLREGRVERFGPLSQVKADTRPKGRPVSHVPQKAS